MDKEIECEKCDGYNYLDIELDQFTWDDNSDNNIVLSHEFSCECEIVNADGTWDICGHGITMTVYAKVHTVEIDGGIA